MRTIIALLVLLSALISRAETVTFDESTATPLQRQLVEKAKEVVLAFSDYPLELASAIKINGPRVAENSDVQQFYPRFLGQEYYEVVFIDPIPAFSLALVRLQADLTPMVVFYDYNEGFGYGFGFTPFEEAKNDTVEFKKIKFRSIPESRWARLREARKNGGFGELRGWEWWWQ